MNVVGTVGPSIPEQNTPSAIYGGDMAVTVQSYTPLNVKRGTQWEFSTYNPTFAGGSTRYYVVITGSKPALIKGRAVYFTGAGLRLSTYRDPVYTGGTPVTFYNCNYRNPVAAELQILVDPSVTSEGVKIAADKHPLGTSPVGSASTSTLTNEGGDLEYLLDANSTYLFSTTNLDAGAIRVSSFTTWYEGDTDV